MKEQQKIIENYIASYNSLDVDGMIKDLSPHIVFENISDGEIDMKLEGLEAFKAQATSAKQYFSQRRQTVTNWEFNDSSVVINIDYHAILAIDLPNGLKVGDTLKLKGQSEFVFEDRQIIRITDKS